MSHRLWKASFFLLDEGQHATGRVCEAMRLRPRWAGTVLHTWLAMLQRRLVLLWIQSAGEKNGVMMFMWHLVNSCCKRNQTQPKFLVCTNVAQNNATTHPKSVFRFGWVTGVEQQQIEKKKKKAKTSLGHSLSPPLPLSLRLSLSCFSSYTLSLHRPLSPPFFLFLISSTNEISRRNPNVTVFCVHAFMM